MSDDPTQTSEAPPFSPGAQMKIGKDGAVTWYRPPALKTKFDFPRAK